MFSVLIYSVAIDSLPLPVTRHVIFLFNVKDIHIYIFFLYFDQKIPIFFLYFDPKNPTFPIIFSRNLLGAL